MFDPVSKFSERALIAALCTAMWSTGAVLADTPALSARAPLDVPLGAPLSLPAAAIAKTETKTKTKTAGEFEKLSDRQLTDLAADWRTLDGVERSELISETRDRMLPETGLPGYGAVPNPKATVGSGAQAPAAKRRTRTIQRRRFGRLVRQPDGTVVRIQAEFVRVLPQDPKRAYGVGFERRHPQLADQVPDLIQDVPARRQSDNLRRQPLNPRSPQHIDVISVQDPGS